MNNQIILKIPPKSMMEEVKGQQISNEEYESFIFWLLYEEDVENNSYNFFKEYMEMYELQYDDKELSNE